MRNIIDAIITLVKQNETYLNDKQIGNNRVNIAGYALEDYVKNLFANTFDCSEVTREQQWKNVFSYIGNDSNPPDLMLRNGDAIEVKKIQSENAALALNSSYPKHTLLKTNPMITNECREAEDWTEKDIIYTIGVVKNNKLKHLCMVYGRNYCASDEIYNKCFEKYKNDLEWAENLDFHSKYEQGFISTDPLGITKIELEIETYIENPCKVFNYVYERNKDADFNFMCLIDYDKWNQFNNVDKLLKLQSVYSNLKINDVKIKNPDNPAQLINAKLITYYFKEKRC